MNKRLLIFSLLFAIITVHSLILLIYLLSLASQYEYFEYILADLLMTGIVTFTFYRMGIDPDYDSWFSKYSEKK